MGKEATPAGRVRRRERKNIASGVAHVNASFNNTMITITDAQGNTIAWSSSGQQGFKGSRKSTPFAAQMAAENAGRKAMEHGMRTLEIEAFALRSQSLGQDDDWAGRTGLRLDTNAHRVRAGPMGELGAHPRSQRPRTPADRTPTSPPPSARRRSVRGT